MKRVNLAVPFAILSMTIASGAFADDVRNVQTCNSKMITELKDLKGIGAEKYTQKQNLMALSQMRTLRTTLASYKVFARDAQSGNVIAKADCVVNNRRKKIISFDMVRVTQKTDSEFALVD